MMQTRSQREDSSRSPCGAGNPAPCGAAGSRGCGSNRQPHGTGRRGDTPVAWTMPASRRPARREPQSCGSCQTGAPRRRLPCFGARIPWPDRPDSEKVLDGDRQAGLGTCIERVPVRVVRFAVNLLADCVETDAIEGVPVKVFAVAKAVAACFRPSSTVNPRSWSFPPSDPNEISALGFRSRAVVQDCSARTL